MRHIGYFRFSPYTIPISDRYWQELGAPQCSVSATWNTLTVNINGADGLGGVFVSSLDSITDRQVYRANTTTGGGWWRGVTVNPWASTWIDDGSCADASESTVKPQTGYRGEARITATYAGVGHNGNCATGTIPNPPMTNPSAGVSVTQVTDRLQPRLTRTWNGGTSSLGTGPVVTQIRINTAQSWSGAARTGSSTTTESWGSTYNSLVRSAANQRLANWGFWTSATSAVTPTAAGWGVRCPNTTPIGLWTHPSGGYSYYAVVYGAVTNTYCEVRLNFIENDLTRTKQNIEFFGPREEDRCENGWWTSLPINPNEYRHCKEGIGAIRAFSYRYTASTYEGLAGGTHISTYRYTYGASAIPSSSAYIRSWYSAGPVNQYALPIPYSLPGGCPAVPVPFMDNC